VLGIRDNINILFAAYRPESSEGLLKQRFSFPEYIKELLGFFTAAQRPETTTHSTSHDYDIPVVHPQCIFY
jgi:hypothetical protein